MLDFSDTCFTDFFASELQFDIDDPRYAEHGGSKGKRLRCFLQKCDDPMAVQALDALWEHRSEHLARTAQADPVENAEPRFRALVDRRSGGTGQTMAKPAPLAVDRTVTARIKADLLQMSTFSPQARGYAFEKFLKDVFDAFGLAAHDPFRLRGEQIDGSFLLANETYLLEAKWHGQPIGVADLHTFHGKIEQKAAWTHGLFVSNSSFTEDGLATFGRGKRVICMDGLDLYDLLNREIPLNQVLERKVRTAAETGLPFLRVRDLFPS